MPLSPLHVVSTGDSGPGSLREAIFFANAHPGSTIDFSVSGPITLTKSLPMITADVTINGGAGVTIDANHTGRVFFVEAGTVAISDITIENALTHGGNGGAGAENGGGGGGGLGAGAAVFVNTGASATLSSVAVQDAAAVGGAGGNTGTVPTATGGGGGGGLGGNGGSSGGPGGAGGGGYDGIGGAGGAGGGGAGGGGEFGAGGAGSGGSPAAGGGGGGGSTTDGSPGSGPGGAAGGLPEGGAGGNAGNPGITGSALGGGGGGGSGGTGGAGGLGGGGGGAEDATGGAGGDFGGGGGTGDLNSVGGGAGGFGGGGGGGRADASQTGGTGGFGAGGGGAFIAGAGGTFAGTGGAGVGAGGGGGAALGGAVFVSDGGTLILNDGSFTGTYGVTAGSGAAGGTTPATDGEAHGTVMFLDATAATTLDVSAGHTTTIAGTDATAGDIAGDGALTKTGAGTLVLGGVNTFGGELTISAGTLTVGNDGALGTCDLIMAAGSTLAFSGDHSIANNIFIAGDPTFAVAAGHTDTITGVITDDLTPGVVEKTGAGTLVLAAANTYSGGTTILAGTLSAADVDGSFNIDALGSGAVTLNGGALKNGTGSEANLVNEIVLGVNGGSIFGTGGSPFDVKGNISGGGPLTFAGFNILLGTDTNTGATIVDFGVLRAGSAGSFSSASAFQVTSNGNLDVNGFNVAIGSLADSGGAGGTVMDGDTVAATLTTGGDNTSTSFSGTIEDGAHLLSLTKVGTGIFTLAGADTYTGATTVNAGKLQVDGSIVSHVFVNAGGSLGGDGTVADVSVATGGTLSPGDSPGILHTGNVTLAGGAHFAAELGGATAGVGGYDQLAVTGTVNLAGATLDLALINGFRPGTGATFDIIDDTGGVTGTFAGLAEGAVFSTAAGARFKITYHGGDGNDVVLTMLGGVTIVISKPGNHRIDATHTVAGQPFPTNFDDLIVCRRGNDTVHAGAGNDTIIGGPGNDKLYGGPDDDVLIAGRGHNLLVGGPGDDTFVFKRLNGDTHVAGFTHGEDTLEFAKSVFKSAAHIHYDASTGALLFAPGSGWSQSVQFATLAPHLHITQGDFLFV